MALCIRDMAKAAAAYAKFENPDQFRAVDTENETRPDLLFVGIDVRASPIEAVYDLTMQDSILSLPLNESPKLVCCGKSIKHFPSKYIHRVRILRVPMM